MKIKDIADKYNLKISKIKKFSTRIEDESENEMEDLIECFS